MEKLFFTLEISPKVYSPTKSINGITSNIPGIHNVQNVLAACAMACRTRNKARWYYKKALDSFEGVKEGFLFYLVIEESKFLMIMDIILSK